VILIRTIAALLCIASVIAPGMVAALNAPSQPAIKYSKKKHVRHMNRALAAYRALSPRKGWKDFGQSNESRPLRYRAFGQGRKTVLFVGGLHGDEPAGVIAALKLADALKRNEKKLLCRAIVVPCINPDGLVAQTRVNAGKVDLNRNFPAENWQATFAKAHNHPGASPASEPETRALIALMEEFPPDLVIQLHQPFNAIYPDYNVDLRLLERISTVSGIPILWDIGYGTPGSFGSYLKSKYADTGMITYEMCRADIEPDYRRIVQSLLEPVLTQWETRIPDEWALPRED
jgi:murein peptide amidase A